MTYILSCHIRKYHRYNFNKVQAKAIWALNNSIYLPDNHFHIRSFCFAHSVLQYDLVHNSSLTYLLTLNEFFSQLLVETSIKKTKMLDFSYFYTYPNFILLVGIICSIGPFVCLCSYTFARKHWCYKKDTEGGVSWAVIN